MPDAASRSKWVPLPTPGKMRGFVLVRYTAFMTRERYREQGRVRNFNWWHEAHAKAAELNKEVVL